MWWPEPYQQDVVELNVVDYNFVLRLLEQDLKVPFKAGTSQLQCTNGSRMVVMGYASQ